MKKQLIAFITAASVASVTLSAPAKADPGRNLANILLGVIVLGAIASSVNEGNAHVTVQPNRRHDVHNNQRQNTHRKNTHRQKTHRAQKPRHCLERVHTRHGWKKRYDRRCMKRHGWHFERGHGWVKNRRHGHR